MNESLKRQLAALAPRAVAAPRAALITVSPGDRGRPAVDVPSAIVARGDVVVWTAAQDDARSWHVVFQAMRPEATIDPGCPASGAGERRAQGGRPPDPDYEPLSVSAPVLSAMPLQTAMLRISPNARPGVYRYGLLAGDDLVPDVDPPPVDYDEELVVLFERVEEDSDPI